MVPLDARDEQLSMGSNGRRSEDNTPLISRHLLFLSQLVLEFERRQLDRPHLRLGCSDLDLPELLAKTSA